MAITLGGSSRQASVTSERALTTRTAFGPLSPSGSVGGTFSVTALFGESKSPGPLAVSASVQPSGSVVGYLYQAATASTSLYVTQINFAIAAPATGVAGSTPGTFVWHRFTGTPPTAVLSQSHVIAKKSTYSSASTFAVSANTTGTFTTTGLTKGEHLLTIPVANLGGPFVQNVMYDEDEIVRIPPGEGILFAVGASLPLITMMYTYTIHFFEK